ncbi:MAG: type I-C CRISPR-associated protein Cas8c/Csd1 [Clostridia bacterium]
MSWVNALSELYDNNAWRAGEVEGWNGKQLVLMPIGYSTVKARIEIQLDAEGCFIDARALPKGENLDTLAPTTEKSMSRSSTSVAPHPLFDSLKYLAGDYLEYVDYDLPESELKKKKSHISECFSKYQSQLEAWCDSAYSNLKVCAVYQYISKKTLLNDLMNKRGLLNVKDGRVSADQNVCGEVLEKAAVRFCVRFDQGIGANILSQGAATCTDSRIWLDKSVQKSFIDYYASVPANKDLCYFTGDRTRITTLLPKKIRYDGDGAKLISSNDSANFTYRGRFLTKDKDSGSNEALTIGYEMAQKIHNALKWIIRRQGYTRDGVCVVTWESDLTDIPQYYRGANEICNLSTDEDVQNESDILFDEPETESVDTNYTSARDFNMTMEGYSKNLRDTSQMVVLALDSASSGRLAMTYYKELASSTYLSNILAWQESCCWRHEYYNKEHKISLYDGMPSINEIARAIYGTEQNKVLMLRANSDGKNPMLISVFDRLRPCIIDGAAIPHDIVKMSVQKASNPMAYEKHFNCQHVLHIACSLVKKFYWDKGVKYDMELDETCTNRSYLFGRLIAVAEKVERNTYDKGETRTTNAERYMQQFSRTPMRTWELIRISTQVYLNQLKPGSREFYKNLYGEIDGLFLDGDYAEKNALDGRFLLGYDCQREALKGHKNGNGNVITDEDETANTDGEEN